MAARGPGDGFKKANSRPKSVANPKATLSDAQKAAGFGRISGAVSASHYTPELGETYCRLLESGLCHYQAGEIIGYRPEAIRNWRNQNPEFAAAVQGAIAGRIEQDADEELAELRVLRAMRSNGAEAAVCRDWSSAAANRATALTRVAAIRLPEVYGAKKQDLPVPLGPGLIIAEGLSHADIVGTPNPE